MLKKLLKAILKYPIIILNRVYTRIYFTVVKNNDECKELDIKSDQNIIVLSPHVDDETIGMGGTLIKYSKMNSDMTLIYLTDGSGSTSDKSESEVIEERKNEGIAVKKSYGFKDVYFLDQLDGSLNSNDNELIYKLKDIVNLKKPHAIFSTFLIDGNKDHMETTKAISKALEISEAQPQDIYLYEVNNLIHPKIVNTISVLDNDIYREKKEKYKIFKSQWAMGFSVYDLMDFGRGLNYSSKNSIEPFVDMSPEQLKSAIESLEKNGFDPLEFKQISSEFTFLSGMFKNKIKKNKYNKILRELLDKQMGGSS